MLSCSQQNFPCVPLFPKSIFCDFGVPCSLNTAFVPMFPALFSSCSLVPDNFKALKPGGPSLIWGNYSHILLYLFDCASAAITSALASVQCTISASQTLTDLLSLQTDYSGIAI